MGRGREAWRVVAAVVIPLGCALAAVAVLSSPIERVVARRDIALVGGDVEARDVKVRCGLVSTSGDGTWGAAAGMVCEKDVLTRLARAGGLAVAGGVVGLALVAYRRNRRQLDRRLLLVLRAEGAVSSVLLAVGLSAAGLGVGLQLFGDEIVPLTVDEAVVFDALAERNVLGAFEVPGLGATGGGRYEQELWVVVAAGSGSAEDVVAVRDVFTGLGWELGEVRPESSDGWVDFRGLADTVDQVEVGLASDALAPEADVSVNARRLLAAVVSDETPAVAVHVAPSRLAPG